MILAQPMENSTFQGRVITTEVDFSSIVGLWGADNRLLVEVNEAPVTFVAGKLSTRKQEPIDLSGGQIQKAPYHFVRYVFSIAIILMLFFLSFFHFFSFFLLYCFSRLSHKEEWEIIL